VGKYHPCRIAYAEQPGYRLAGLENQTARRKALPVAPSPRADPDLAEGMLHSQVNGFRLRKGCCRII
jgi:hypothetical protein